MSDVLVYTGDMSGAAQSFLDKTLPFILFVLLFKKFTIHYSLHYLIGHK